MRCAYLDCASGISGDMTLGALVNAGVELESIQQGIDSLGLPSCRLVAEKVKRRGFQALKVSVEHDPEHAHRHLHHITDMIDGSNLTARQKDLAKRIFTRLGKAEAKVHGTTIQKVHFHEVGAVDSIADIVGSAIAWDLLGVERIICSPVPTGQGTITIAHGICSVPAPATAELLTGIPLAASTTDAELTTPTGAAIVATLVDEFGPLPPMQIEAIGYGAGNADFEEQANILRLMVGHTTDLPSSDQVCLLETNLDDTSGELIGHACSLLMKQGALDVYTTAIQMKKNRPGIMLSVLCNMEDMEQMKTILFRETLTLGIRYQRIARFKLKRNSHSVETQWGQVEGKTIHLPDGKITFSPEYESCRNLALANQVSLPTVFAAARQAFHITQT